MEMSSDSPDWKAIFRILLFKVTIVLAVTVMGAPSFTRTLTCAFLGSVPSNQMGELKYELLRMYQ
jgi:hypothetical protein